MVELKSLFKNSERRLNKLTKQFRILSIMWMGVIFFFSSLTKTDLKQMPNVSDILAHGAVYSLLGVLLYFSFSRYPSVKAVLLSFLYGISDEFHQSFVPGRTPEIKDLIVDTTAALISVLVIKLLSRVNQKR